VKADVEIPKIRRITRPWSCGPSAFNYLKTPDGTPILRGTIIAYLADEKSLAIRGAAADEYQCYGKEGRAEQYVYRGGGIEMAHIRF